MRKYFLVISVVFIIFIVGCSNDESSDETNGEEGSNLELKLSTQATEDNPTSKSMLEFMSDVEENSDGSIEFDYYPANQLGDYTTVFEEVIKGTIEMAQLSIPSEIDSRVEILNMPYLVRDYDHGREVYTAGSYFHEFIFDILEEQNIHLVGFTPIGFGGIGSTQELTNYDKIGEDKDITARVPQMTVYQKYATAMGFKTNSIPFADVFTALQTGTVEGVMGGTAATNYVSYRDVLTHYYQYNNTFEAIAVIMNKDVWDDLTDEQREMIDESAEVMTDNSIKYAETNDQDMLDNLREDDIEVFEFSTEEIENFAETIYKDVWPEFEDVIGKEELDKLLEEIK